MFQSGDRFVRGGFRVRAVQVACGGQIIATGTPEQVAANPDSVTGKYLLPLLQK